MAGAGPLGEGADHQAGMRRQTEIARKLAAELALPPAQRSRAGMGPPGAALPDDKWSI